MKNILFIAPPAGGKGTQSEALVEKCGYIHISTGDLLRDVDPETELGKKIREVQASGELVSDDIVFELLENKMKSLDGKHFILDGCVRNLAQAEKLEDMFTRLGISLDAVINLDVPYDTLLKRTLGRVNCPNCKSTFNTYFKKPQVENICDKCGKELISRNDDNEETFKVRYQTYLDSTKPLIDYYEKEGKLVTIDGASDDTFERIVEVVKND